MPATRINRAKLYTNLLRKALLAALVACLTVAPAVPQAKKAQRGEQPGQDEPVRLHSAAVIVSLTVTDQAGQYAHGLSAKDFTVLEDGVAQAIDSFSAQEAPFAAAILIDMSGSMEYRFGLVRGAAASFIENIRENDQVAVYGFNNKVRLFQDFSNSRDITDYVWDAKAEDTTSMYDCMDEAIEALAKREEKRRAVLLISDGWDSSSRKASFDSVMKKASNAGVTVYSVDLTDDNQMMRSGSLAINLRRGRGEMKEFAGQTGGHYVRSPQGENLEAAFVNIIEELRNQYTLTYYSTNPKRDGRWRKLSVSTPREGLVTRARRGYYSPKE
jgi:Ca-activated chloride channel family protein